MANTLTGLIPTIYAALNTVSRELVGFIPAVRKNTALERAAKDQTVRVPIVPATTAYDITPGQQPSDNGDVTLLYTDITISKSRQVPVRWNGEEQKSLKNGLGLYADINQQRFAQAMRTLTNEMETDLGGLYKYASRAYGTAGTTPFAAANELDDVSYVRKILEDNGSPTGDLHLIIDTAAGAKLGGYQSALFKVNESGTSDLLRRGTIGELEGFAVGKSAKVASHTAGTLVNLDSDGGEPVNETTIAVDGNAESGTILIGDALSWVGDSEKYIVQSATASGATDGNIVIASPGLQSVLADGVVGTISAAYTANMAFDRNAIVLVTRAPAVPEEGDAAYDSVFVTDSISGISFEIRAYKEYHQIKYEVCAAWGYKMVKPEHCALLLG